MAATGSPIVLILGAGPGIGANVAARFAEKGYAIASAARSLSTHRGNGTHLDLNLDLSRADSVPAAFNKVEDEFGAPPSVVVYNAHRTLVDANNPLGSMSSGDYNGDMTVNLHNAVTAAQEAVRGFKKLPDTHSKTFIYSGNKLNVMADPKTWAFGIARTGMAHFIWDCSVAYRSVGYRFYFTDERLKDGSPSRTLMDPVERAALYLRLCEAKEQGPWHYTYVKGIDYVDFRTTDRAWEVV